jgi:hypothetical protein
MFSPLRDEKKNTTEDTEMNAFFSLPFVVQAL